jgi:hypothetical protein
VKTSRLAVDIKDVTANVEEVRIKATLELHRELLCVSTWPTRIANRCRSMSIDLTAVAVSSRGSGTYRADCRFARRMGARIGDLAKENDLHLIPLNRNGYESPTTCSPPSQMPLKFSRSVVSGRYFCISDRCVSCRL